MAGVESITEMGDGAPSNVSAIPVSTSEGGVAGTGRLLTIANPTGIVQSDIALRDPERYFARNVRETSTPIDVSPTVTPNQSQTDNLESEATGNQSFNMMTSEEILVQRELAGVELIHYSGIAEKWEEEESVASSVPGISEVSVSGSNKVDEGFEDARSDSLKRISQLRREDAIEVAKEDPGKCETS
jgi:hypothetical protein